MHIYAVSRLFHKAPTQWLGAIRRMERGGGVMRAVYAPLRYAIVEELKSPGSGNDYLRQKLQSQTPTASQLRVREKSLDAFATFCTRIRPHIARLEASYLSPAYRPGSVEFGGHRLEGRFHMAVKTPEEQTKYVYLHTSEWAPEEVESFLELLAILAERRHGARREDVWFVDLQRGRILHPPRVYRHVRRELEKTLDLLEIIQRATTTDYEAA